MTMKTVSVSEFKAKCLALLAAVQTTGEALLVTKRGKPLVRVLAAGREDRHRWLGAMEGTAEIVGDIVAPAVPARDWNAMRP